VLVSLVYWRITRYVRGAMVIAFGVLSHWFLDFVTHRPDLPLCPGGLKLGLGLWKLLAGHGGDWKPSCTRWPSGFTSQPPGPATVPAVMPCEHSSCFLIVTYIAARFSPPRPPTRCAIMWVGFASWLNPLWAWWFDRHRELRSAT